LPVVAVAAAKKTIVEKKKLRFAAYSPLGVAIEVLEGPLAGSKVFSYFTPNEERTDVTVAGDFKSATMSDDLLRQTVS
jgi:hypothetical protein